jgi:hypothetical protein
MPLFELNKNPSDLPPQIFDVANALIDRLRARRVAEITLPAATTGLRTSNLVRCYLQAHIRRCLVFVEAGAAELDADRPLAAELCTRAIYENVATICDFTDKLKPLCESLDYAGVNALVSKAAFSTRIPSFIAYHGDEVKAPQILNQIDKMSRRYPDYRQAYDHLSDIVHPNGLGAVVYFGKFVETGMRFEDAGDSNSAERARTSLILAAQMLLHVELALLLTEECLNKLDAAITTKNHPKKLMRGERRHLE